PTFWVGPFGVGPRFGPAVFGLVRLGSVRVLARSALGWLFCGAGPLVAGLARCFCGVDTAGDDGGRSTSLRRRLGRRRKMSYPPGIIAGMDDVEGLTRFDR